MKKVFLFVSLIGISLLSFAKDEVNVKSGDPKFLISEASTATVTIDFTNAVVEEGETITEYLNRRGEDWVNDWPQVQQEVKDVFVNVFNKKNKKGMQIVDDGEAVTYYVIIDVSAVDFGNTANAFVKNPFGKTSQGGASISGTLSVVDVSTKEVKCTMEIDEVIGVATYSETGRLKITFMYVAKNALSAAKKYK